MTALSRGCRDKTLPDFQWPPAQSLTGTPHVSCLCLPVPLGGITETAASTILPGHPGGIRAES